MYCDILFNIYFDILSDICSDILSDILSGILSGVRVPSPSASWPGDMEFGSSRAGKIIELKALLCKDFSVKAICFQGFIHVIHVSKGYFLWKAFWLVIYYIPWYSHYYVSHDIPITFLLYISNLLVCKGCEGSYRLRALLWQAMWSKRGTQKTGATLW